MSYSAFEWYTIEYPTRHLYFLRTHTSLREVTSDMGDIPWFIKRKLCITVLNYVIETAWPYTINAVHYVQYRRIRNGFTAF